MKYTKYKTRVKLVLTGDDDMFISSQSSVYSTNGAYINGKTIRFNLNSSFNDVYCHKMPVVLWRLVMFQILQV